MFAGRLAIYSCALFAVSTAAAAGSSYVLHDVYGFLRFDPGRFPTFAQALMGGVPLFVIWAASFAAALALAMRRVRRSAS